MNREHLAKRAVSTMQLAEFPLVPMPEVKRAYQGGRIEVTGHVEIEPSILHTGIIIIRHERKSGLVPFRLRQYRLSSISPYE